MDICYEYISEYRVEGGKTLVGFDGSAPVIVQGYHSVSCRGILCEQDVKKRW